MFSEEIVYILEQAGLGIYGTSIFTGSASRLPPGPGPFISIVTTSGTDPDQTHNAAAEGKVAYVRPGTQLWGTAERPDLAEQILVKALTAVYSIRNREVLGVYWVNSQWLNGPSEMGRDATGMRTQFVGNMLVRRRPSTEASVPDWRSPDW